MTGKLLKLALATSALVTFGTAAIAQETVVWWDFLSGGDGVRMKALIDEFNAEHEGEIAIEATTLEWGVPFYTRVQTSAAIGEGPDVMTYHVSRVPLGVESGALAEITEEDLATVGLSSDDYAASNWDAAHYDGKLYAVPFDVHSVVLYYNKDALAEAGLLGEDGLPDLDGADNFKAAVETLKGNGYEYGISLHTAAGDSQWRIFLSLLDQQDGVFLNDDGEFLAGDNLDKAVNAVELVSSLVEEGLAPRQTEYEASIALFSSGAAPMHINGVWEVPTFTDLAAKDELGFEWGAIALPTLFNHPATWADSHTFTIPNNAGNEMSAEKKAAVMEVIAWMNQNSLSWADAGHIPAYEPVRTSEEFKTMQPNATYSVLADTAVFDPRTPLAGVASPVYDAAGNYLMPAINGEIDAQGAMEDMRDDLQEQAED